MIKSAPPGIFNDAIGPIMRGPSSSHTAGAHRIAAVLKQLSRGVITKAVFKFHPSGSLAETYNTQGSDIGLAAGLLGIDITDPRMPDSLNIAKSQGLDIVFSIEDYPADHPNTYDCELINNTGEIIKAVALSTGGGLIQFINFQGFEIYNQMDLPTLMFEGALDEFEKISQLISQNNADDKVWTRQVLGSDERKLLSIVFKEINPRLRTEFNSDSNLWIIDPVYPVPGYTGALLPFKSASDIEADKDLNSRQLWELAIEYESIRSNISKEDVFSKMLYMIDILRQAIKTGLDGTNYSDRILGSQSPTFQKAFDSGKLLPAGPLSRMTAYTIAIMESKSAMEVIIASPTAGAAGGMPGSLIGMADEIKASSDDLVKAFLAAGLIGVFISKEATFAAEVAGCQAETGAGAAMAAAGLVQLVGGNAKLAIGAASLALQNIMGLVCDPVGNRVEIPCLGRNVQSCANALSSANMILGEVDHVIPLSETIVTMLKVGQALPRELRCTSLGGLAITPTAKRIEEKLKNKR